MTTPPRFVIKKNSGLDQQRQPNIFVLQPLFKKLHGEWQIGPPCTIG